MMASAPGKILIAGEYAVLDGHPALIMAIGVRARAEIASGSPPQSDFLAAAAEVIAEECGADSTAAENARRIVVDTAEFSMGGAKLGLGSSAAATVAAIACALFSKKGRISRPKIPITMCPTHMRAGASCGTPDCERVFALARLAHARAQKKRGAAGSGADIAAATFGGTLVYQSKHAGSTTSAADAESPTVRPWTIPADLTFVPVWTHKPASTARLVAQVAAARAANPAAADRALDGIAGVAHQLIAARAAPEAIAAIAAGNDACANLAAATLAPLVIPAHQAIAKLAQQVGGAAKPTGAGGGDIALCALPDPDAAARFRALAADAGLLVIDAGIDSRGVTLTSCTSTAPGA